MRLEIKGTILKGYDRGIVYENKCEFTDNGDGTDSGSCCSVPVEKDICVLEIDLGPLLPQLKTLINKKQTTAEKMFEALEYRKVKSPDHLLIYKYDDDLFDFHFTVGFNLASEVYYAESEVGALGITEELHQAITQQMYELRWID